MAVLVTGGAGFIGSHTAIQLLEKGYDIIVVDNLVNSSVESLNRVRRITGKDFKFYEADLVNKEEIRKIFIENNIEAVIHFAGLKAVGESVSIPLRYYHNNLLSTLNLCEVMEEFNIKKLVFSSSATVYGNPSSVPISEVFPLSATNPYGRTKLMIEDILRDLYASDNDWSIALLRYFNPIGAHSSGLIGEDPKGIPNNLVPYIAQVAGGKLDYLKVFGNTHPTKDGTGVRDYIHVVDLAGGHIKALEKVSTSKGIEAYNLGTGNGYTVLEVVEAYSKACGREIPYKIVDNRPGDVAACFADTSKAKEELGFSTTLTLQDMCMDSWKWQSNNPNGYEK
ncbi:UDP-glucose 4-epimerase GalE [Clostridium sp. YIM B02515]|uniref:UDP-glucose 4-epimerase n=1 Tax=Clostridium rhizosphaerae TaxID=2803861 RepID=A0ABS1TCT7_9CLOT|nr:UDP-glucose 4-epimerase GalE [Clostridium rhizosphaerae]MBL4937145.1 UDP-glucose 4-epimerase GalE [Clostridium rhizosphaerae]